MDNVSFFIYLLVVAGSTYLIRVIPFAASGEKIRSRFIRSFLYYIPFTVLTVMTIPAVFFCSERIPAAAAGVLVAVVLSWRGCELTAVAAAACLAVFIVSFF